MDSRPAYVTSDVHLGAVSPSTEQAFHAWLRWAASRASTIVINGDLFDFWFEYRSVIPRGYTRTLGLLAEVVDSGVPVHLLGGNHDWWGGSYLEDEVGVHFHRTPVRLELAGHRCLVAHGDGMGRGDLGYRILRAFLRGRVTRTLFRWIHPDVGAGLARRVSRTEVRRASLPREESPRERELLRWARERLMEDKELDVVLVGHTHSPARVEIAPGRFYLNSGDWLHHASFAVLPPGENAYLAHWRDGRKITGGMEGGSIST